MFSFNNLRLVSAVKTSGGWLSDSWFTLVRLIYMAWPWDVRKQLSPNFLCDLDERSGWARRLSASEFCQKGKRSRIPWLCIEHVLLSSQLRHLKNKIESVSFILVHFKSLLEALPGLTIGTILEIPLALDGNAIIGFPLPSDPWAAPRMKSTCPPNPEYILVPIESETICPVRSHSMQELMAVIFGIWEITLEEFT